MEPPADRPSVVTPGNYDGVHLGHQSLIDRAQREASARGLRCVPMFFDPHPVEVLRQLTVPRLTTATRRAELLRHYGADHVHIEPFTETFSKLSPEAFVDRVLVEGLGARLVVVGPDFRFGHERAGDVDALEHLGATKGFEVDVAEAMLHDGNPISSTRIREALTREDGLGEANTLLGRAYDIQGVVERGDQRGRTLGFPTANLGGVETMVPADGVYAVMAKWAGRRIGGVANVGLRPTFDAGRTVEVHLFDFDENLYGQEIRVAFVRWIRGVVKFDGVDALRTQIATDAARARQELETFDGELVKLL